jgi:hypothetical protein
MAWGNPEPEVLVLGFSKGPTQSHQLLDARYESIPYRGGRLNIGKILAHVGLIEAGDEAHLKRQVDIAIEDTVGRFAWGSLVRCTVERYEAKSGTWKGSGGGMLDRFIATDFGRDVVSSCVHQHLGALPSTTRLIVMFGLGTKLNYVDACSKVLRAELDGEFERTSEVSYRCGNVAVVHVEHFAAQGALIPNWLGPDHPRGRYGRLAQEAVRDAVGS